MGKLNQVLAVEKGVKQRSTKALTDTYKLVQKDNLFQGFQKSWQQATDSSEVRPPEAVKVQVRADDVLDSVKEALTELMDITAQKDYANCNARADVVVGGRVILSQAPVTYLLFLEKALTDLRTLVSKLPVLSEDEDWRKNEATGLFVTEPKLTQSTRKEQKPIVLYDATDRHPAQTQLVSQDVVVGHWETVKQSGAFTKSRKKELMSKVETLLKAVKMAREEGNSCEATPVNVASEIFTYLLED